MFIIFSIKNIIYSNIIEMKGVQVNLEMVNCALLCVILILVIICCTQKSEGFGDVFDSNIKDKDDDDDDDDDDDEEESCSDDLSKCSNALKSSIAEHKKYVKTCDKHRLAAKARCDQDKLIIKKACVGGPLPPQ
jgi:hypothetical protein